MQTRILQIDPKKIVLLKVNARYMRHETFMRLVENVKKDKALTSVPFCAILGYYTASDPIQRGEDGEPLYEVLSGNHRVQAAIDAGLPFIEVMVTDEPLTDDQRKGIQLSHNELAGEDDPAQLKLIYDSITDLSWRLYSGLDDKKLEMLEEVKPGSLSEANLAFQSVSMVFLPEEAKQVDAVWEIAKEKASKFAWISNFREYDKYMDAIEAASEAHGIKNVATALMVVLEVFTRHLDDLQEGFLDKDNNPLPGHVNVPIVPVLGSNTISPKAASNLKKIIGLLTQAEKIKDGQRWRVMEIITEKFLHDLNGKG